VLHQTFLSLFHQNPRPLGRTPFPFLPSPLHIFLHLLLISLLSSRLFLFPPPLLPSLPALLASLHSLLPHNRQSRTVSVPCPFLADIACHYVSLCRSLISLLLHLPFSFLLRLGSQPEIQMFLLSNLKNTRFLYYFICVPNCVPRTPKP